MNFEELAPQVATNLADMGYNRVTDQPGWIWEHDGVQAELSKDPMAPSEYPYFVSISKNVEGIWEPMAAGVQDQISSESTPQQVAKKIADVFGR